MGARVAQKPNRRSNVAQSCVSTCMVLSLVPADDLWLMGGRQAQRREADGGPQEAQVMLHSSDDDTSYTFVPRMGRRGAPGRRTGGEGWSEAFSTPGSPLPSHRCTCTRCMPTSDVLTLLCALCVGGGASGRQGGKDGRSHAPQEGESREEAHKELPALSGGQVRPHICAFTRDMRAWSALVST